MSNPNDLFDIITEHKIDGLVIGMVIALVVFGFAMVYVGFSKLSSNQARAWLYFLLTGLMCTLIAVVHDYGFVSGEKNIWYLSCFGFAFIYFMLLCWNTYAYFKSYKKEYQNAYNEALPPTKNV
jgi:Na+-transporting NADH:ubiquinone oxidoreductase subunit NqrB